MIGRRKERKQLMPSLVLGCYTCDDRSFQFNCLRSDQVQGAAVYLRFLPDSQEGLGTSDDKWIIFFEQQHELVYASGNIRHHD